MRRSLWLVWGSVLLLSSHGCLAEEILELSRSFIEQHKNRLTIDVMYLVDAAHKKPNPPGKDGDMHVAGRAAEIGLATVAEIQNAKDVPDAVNRVRGVEGSGQAIALSGVWRIWPEHGGDNFNVTTSPTRRRRFECVWCSSGLYLLISLYLLTTNA